MTHSNWCTVVDRLSFHCWHITILQGVAYKLNGCPRPGWSDVSAALLLALVLITTPRWDNLISRVKASWIEYPHKLWPQRYQSNRENSDIPVFLVRFCFLLPIFDHWKNVQTVVNINVWQIMGSTSLAWNVPYTSTPVGPSPSLPMVESSSDTSTSTPKQLDEHMEAYTKRLKSGNGVFVCTHVCVMAMEHIAVGGWFCTLLLIIILFCYSTCIQQPFTVHLDVKLRS